MLAHRPVRPAAQLRREHRVVLGLGSNHEPERHLRLAVARLGEELGVEAVSIAWQSPDTTGLSHDYVNAAVLVRTPLDQEALRLLLKRIEADLGRRRPPEPGAPVSIDIDLVVYDGLIHEDDLWTQAYRALPTAELLPLLRSPWGEPLGEIARRLAAAGSIVARPDLLIGLGNRSRTAS